MSLKKLPVRLPVQCIPTRPLVEPLVPDPTDRLIKLFQTAEVRGASVVLIVTPELPVESCLLLVNRIMPMRPAPRRHFSETAPEPLSHRPHT